MTKQRFLTLLGSTALTAVVLLSHTTSAFAPSSVFPTRPSRSAAAAYASSKKITTRLHATTSDDEATKLPTRRQIGELSIAALGLGTSFFATREFEPTDYGLYGVLPVGPYKRKKTITKTIVPDTVWTFDQKFGILNVQVPLRMTIVRLKSGGLFVYDPIAATPECLAMVQGLVDKYGPIKHIVLGSVAAEHKVYTGVFAQKFPGAKVWIQPGQYSYPVNLPVSFLGFPSGRTFTMPKSMDEAPDDWKGEFEFLTFGPLISRDGAFGETVFFHKPTKTLLVTDTVIEVTDEVPEIYDDDPKPLLYHARDTVTEVVQDTPDVRKRGWRRVALFGLFFTPAAIVIKDTDTALKERRQDINSDFAGVYPWEWVGDDIKSFKALTGGLLVAPILQKLILNRNPIEVLDFADQVAKWPFERIIPAHFKNDLKYKGKDYRAAFSFLEAKGVPPGLPKPLDIDLKALDDANIDFMESGAIFMPPPAPGGKVTRAEILAQTMYRCRAGICTPRAEP